MNERNVIDLFESIYNPKRRRRTSSASIPKRKERSREQAEATAIRFLQALREAVESGRYYLEEVSYVKVQPRAGMIGRYSDGYIWLINGEACRMYAAAIGSDELLNVVAARLWPDLVTVGLDCKKHSARWNGRSYEVRRLDRAVVECLLPGWKLGK